MRTFVIVLIALAIPLFAGCGSGVTLGTDSPVDIPEQVEAGGVTVQTSEIDVGGFSVDPEEDWDHVPIAPPLLEKAIPSGTR